MGLKGNVASSKNSIASKSSSVVAEFEEFGQIMISQENDLHINQ